jgi:predicted DNA-binding transcriptional regulator AlpA
MDKVVVISTQDLRTLIIDCVNSCIKYNTDSSNILPEQDEWFDVKRLSKFLPTHPTPATIQKWARNGEIPNHRKPGKRKLTFLKSEILLWLKEGRGTTNSEIDLLADEYIAKQKIKQ